MELRRNRSSAAWQANRTPVDVDPLYANLWSLGLQLGPAFRLIQRYWWGNREVLAESIDIEESGRTGETTFVSTPLLDACCQVIGESGLQTTSNPFTCRRDMRGLCYSHRCLRGCIATRSTGLTQSRFGHPRVRPDISHPRRPSVGVSDRFSSPPARDEQLYCELYKAVSNKPSPHSAGN